jgi:hypothetical protein
MQDIGKSYCIAVSASISLALGLRFLFRPLAAGATGGKLTFFNALSSMLACATAGYLNAFFMRKTELNKGIDVLDEEGNSYGKSKTCA